MVEPGGLRVRVLRTLTHLRRHPAHPIAWGLPAALWFLAVLSIVTVFQRLIHAARSERVPTP